MVHNMRLDIGSRTVRTGVVMRDETDGGYIALGVGLQRGIDIATVVHLYVAEPFVFQFLLQVFSENQLFGCTGHAVAIFGRLRVELCIVQKSFGNIHSYKTCDPVGIQTQDLQNRNLTLYSAKLRDLLL